MIEEGKELNDVVCHAYRMGCEQTREVYQKRIEKLEAEEAEFDRVIGNYASENALFRDRIETLEAALRRWQNYGCPDCGGDCGSANPPVACCIMTETRKALEGKDD